MKKPLSPTQHRELIKYICAAAEKSGHRELARESLGADDEHILCLSMVAAYLGGEMEDARSVQQFFINRLGLDKEDVKSALFTTTMSVLGTPIAVVEVSIDKAPEDQ